MLLLVPVAQAHAVHGIQNAALHGLHAVGHIGQGAALDDAERVFQVGTLGVLAQLSASPAAWVAKSSNWGLAGVEIASTSG